jgi:biotin synthase
MSFSPERALSDYGITKEELNETIDSGDPFRTTGCPNCNRPFYNESPKGLRDLQKPLYNYPIKLTKEHITKVKRELYMTDNE